MDGGEPPRLILLDALGTLLALVEPFESFASALARRGVTVTPAEATTALTAEMRYYRAHCQRAGDAASLDQLRDRCTEVLQAALPDLARNALEHAALRQALLEAIHFEPFPDVPPALHRWRAAGTRLAVVSNWDVSLHDALADTGLTPAFELVLSSAEAGASKPDPAIFELALRTLAASPADAVHVGDSEAEDVTGAIAAGIRPVLLRRDGRPAPTAASNTVRSLDKLWPCPRRPPSA